VMRHEWVRSSTLAMLPTRLGKDMCINSGGGMIYCYNTFVMVRPCLEDTGRPFEHFFAVDPVLCPRDKTYIYSVCVNS